MPIYDYKCDNCEDEKLDVYESRVATTRDCAKCGGVMTHMWRSSAAVIGDEVDITIAHGLCNADGTPRRYRSRTEIFAEAKRRGLTNAVEHIGSQGSDKSKNTSRWF